MRRTAYIKANWKDKWAKVALRKVKELWEEYQEQAPTSLASSSPSYSRPSQQPPKELDAFDQIAQNLGKYTQPTSQDEYQDYISRESCDIGKMLALT